jgi:hypothetical protein
MPMGVKDGHLIAAIPAGMVGVYRTISGGLRCASTTGYQL